MENYKYFKNDKCEFYPCHKLDEDGYFNCLFCYCPLYPLGDKCGGNFFYTEKGIKNCSKCSLPHGRNGYEYIRSKLIDVIEMAAKKD